MALNPYFIETREALHAFSLTNPSNLAHFRIPVEGAWICKGKSVDWEVDSRHIVRVPANNVLFMEGNLWNLQHARAIFDGLRKGRRRLQAPAARVYAIDEEAVAQSRRYAKEGQLAYQLGMVRPWQRRDIGSYYAQLVDGNHRALAALAMGDPSICVYVGEDYRENVDPEDYVKV